MLVIYAGAITLVKVAIGFVPSRQSQHLWRRRLSSSARAQQQSDSFVVREFNTIEDLEKIVQLASRPIPERPDGIVVVAKYSSIFRDECVSTEDDYERSARSNPATIFLRCNEEDENAKLLLQQANVVTYPTTDVFYQKNRVARLEGPVTVEELDRVLNMYQLMNSKLDLFSDQQSESRWDDSRAKDPTKTPRTTNRFVPAYDWNKDKGFFDDQGDRAQKSFEEAFENWIPNVDE